MKFEWKNVLFTHNVINWRLIYFMLNASRWNDISRVLQRENFVKYFIYRWLMANEIKINYLLQTATGNGKTKPNIVQQRFGWGFN